MKKYLVEIAVGLAVTAFSGMGWLLIELGSMHEAVAQHTAQAAEHQPIDRLEAQVDAIRTEQRVFREEYNDDKAQERARADQVLRALSRIEGRLGTEE